MAGLREGEGVETVKGKDGTITEFLGSWSAGARHGAGIEIVEMKRQKQVAPLPQMAPPEATADDRAMEGAACERADDVRGAISAYSRALARDPRHLLSLFRLGSLYRHHGKPELAVVYLRRARAASPDHAATARLLEELENTVDVDELEIPLLQEGDAPPFLEDGPLLDGAAARLAGR